MTDRHASSELEAEAPSAADRRARAAAEEIRERVEACPERARNGRVDMRMLVQMRDPEFLEPGVAETQASFAKGAKAEKAEKAET